MAFATVLFEKRGTLAQITLNRPEVHNASNIQMRDDLFEVFSAVRDDPEIRAIVVRGAGDRAFSAGADLTEFGSAPPPLEAREVRWRRDLWGLILSLPQPLIAAVQGYAFGAGLELALCCDIRLAAPNALFGLPEAALGMIPAAGGTQTLPRHTTLSAAVDMLLRARRIDAQEAYRLGIVNHIVEPDRLFTTAERLAARIASWDPATVQRIKRAAVRGLGLPLAQGLAWEQQAAFEWWVAPPAFSTLERS